MVRHTFSACEWPVPTDIRCVSWNEEVWGDGQELRGSGVGACSQTHLNLGRASQPSPLGCLPMSFHRLTPEKWHFSFQHVTKKQQQETNWNLCLRGSWIRTKRLFRPRFLLWWSGCGQRASCRSGRHIVNNFPEVKEATPNTNGHQRQDLPRTTQFYRNRALSRVLDWSCPFAKSICRLHLQITMERSTCSKASGFGDSTTGRWSLDFLYLHGKYSIDLHWTLERQYIPGEPDIPIFSKVRHE